MTFGFALMAIGSIMMLSGYEKKTIGQVLSQLQTKPEGGETAFSAYLKTGGAAINAAFTGAGAGASTSSAGGPSGLSIGGAPRSKALAIAKGVAWATSVSGKFPYSWGGGHEVIGKPGGQGENGGKGYDCSGAVSGVLHAMGLLSTPLVSGQLASWGSPGEGKWITIYANADHTFMKIGGVWFGTGSNKEALRGGPAWGNHDPDLSAYSVRHPMGY